MEVGKIEGSSSFAGEAAETSGDEPLQKQKDDDEEQQQEEVETENTNDECFAKFVPPPLVPLQHHLLKDKVGKKECPTESKPHVDQSVSISKKFASLYYSERVQVNPNAQWLLQNKNKNEEYANNPDWEIGDIDDESLRRWKEKLLGSVEGDLNGQVEPEVTFQSIGIISNDLGENNTPLPLDESQSSKVLFSLKEGSQYRFKLTFTVKYNIVSGLAYFNTVWRAGVQVDQSEGMLGTFAPQQQPYVHLLDEEITPSGALARGVYSAKLWFVDDDKKCHMELSYSFEIKKKS